MPLITPAKIDTRIHPYSIEEGRVHSLRRGGEVEHSCLLRDFPRVSWAEEIEVLEHFLATGKRSNAKKQ